MSVRVCVSVNVTHFRLRFIIIAFDTPACLTLEAPIEMLKRGRIENESWAGMGWAESLTCHAHARSHALSLVKSQSL